MNTTTTTNNTATDEQEAAFLALLAKVPADDRLQVVEGLRGHLEKRAQAIATATELAREVVALQFAQNEAAFQDRRD